MTRYSSFWLGLLSLIFFVSHVSVAFAGEKTDIVDPVELDWRRTVWQSFDYGRIPVTGGAALYTVASPGEKRFLVVLQFAAGTFTFPRSEVSVVEAAAEQLLLGGAGTRSFDVLARELDDNGLGLVSSLSSDGRLVVELTGLVEDFAKGLALLRDLVLVPRFDPDAHALWQQQARDEFERLLSGNSPRTLTSFMRRELSKYLLGPEHYLALYLDYMSPKYFMQVKHDDVKRVARSMLNRTGLNAVLAGDTSAKDRDALLRFLAEIPRRQPPVVRWLPERPTISATEKIPVIIMQKPDMKQSQLELRFVVPMLGELNELELNHYRIFSEAFSSSGGVVGTDRWTKAMRVESGLAYSPYAVLVKNFLSPNTNLGLWLLHSQSPTDRLPEALQLARKTWSDFVETGVTQTEVDSLKRALINQHLGREVTSFERARELLGALAEGKLPSPTPVEGIVAELAEKYEAAAINRTLQKAGRNGLLSAVGIIGNVSDAEVAQIREVNGYKVERVTTFSEAQKSLASP